MESWLFAVVDVQWGFTSEVWGVWILYCSCYFHFASSAIEYFPGIKDIKSNGQKPTVTSVIYRTGSPQNKLLGIRLI